MLTCKEANRLMSEELDRKLSWRERFGIKVHVSMCNGCSNFRKQMTFLRSACKQASSTNERDDD